MATLPCHPRIAKMMMSSETSALKALACDVAALLEEKDPMSDSEDSDMALRLSTPPFAATEKQSGQTGSHRPDSPGIPKDAQGKEDNEPVDAEEVGRLIALAYPVAHRHGHR